MNLRGEKMNKKRLILSIMLVLIVFLSASAVSATDDVNTTLSADETTPAEVTVHTTDNNSQIQDKINSLNDGDTLNFEKGEYANICLYVDKNITINGNGATLHGYDNLAENDARLPDKILNTTDQGGYGITKVATLYIIQTKGLVLKDINIVAGANSSTEKVDNKYSNCVIYSEKATGTQIINTTIDGSTWGIYVFQCADIIIENNRVMNQGVTGILSFQSPRSIIRNNTVTNAKNHGIDVRHQVGNNATIIDNTVSGSKEGIYLLHSGGHTVTGNEIIGCSLSSITCCGAKNVVIENNKFKQSRIGILLGGSAPVGSTAYTAYENITIGANEWTFDKLPMPPSFEFYVAEAKGDYASLDTMVGTYTDSSISDITFVEYTEIEAPKEIFVEYNTILNHTGTTKQITSGMTNDEIQAVINGMENGDTLIFEKDAVFEDICLIINKTIKIIGNNATLKGLNTANKTIILSSSLPDSYTAKTYAAILYSVNNTGVVISDLNIISNYPDYTDPNKAEYKTACIFAENSANLVVTGCSLDGASWGLIAGFQKNGCPNSIITNNKVSNQYTTGILCFGSKFSIIVNNTVTNAKNHGIDVRFNNTGFNVTVFNNTVSGAKEGIYLLHSFGHKVYNNTILNSKISSITCYGSGNEYIFNNTLSGSRVAILLGGGYYNVHIGKNVFIPDKLGKLPPTFEYYIVKGENKYQNSADVQRTYSDKEIVTISAPNVSVELNKTDELTITLIDQNNKVMAGKTISVKFNGANQTLTTNEKGIVTIAIANLGLGNYTAEISFAGSDNYAPTKANATVEITKIATEETNITIPEMTSGKTETVTINLPENATGTVTLTIDGKVISVVNVTDGTATVQIPALASGNHNIQIAYSGDDNYAGFIQTKAVNVKAPATPAATKKAIKITAKKKTFKAKKKTKKYTITLKANGKAVKNLQVTLKVNGKTYKAKTNAKGKATFKITKLNKKGKYTATIKFKGNSAYKAATKKVKITVKK